MKSPTLTVVMPVYNGEKNLTEAIDSVLNQTFNDFEFIIIDDGSTDKSLDIIKTYDDKRIIFINNEKNKGIPYCRNLGLNHAKGEFLAWADCDDLNEPTRFEEQVKFLNKNKEFGICGSSMLRFGMEKYVTPVFNDPELVKATLLFKPSIPNATAMLRLSKIKRFNIKFDESLPIAEDYDFFFRCSLHFPLTNINKILYKNRASETSIMGQYRANESKRDNILKIVNEKILIHIGIIPSESELVVHRSISSSKLFDKMEYYQKAYLWLKLLKLQNKDVGLYQENAFNRVLADQFYFISKKASQLGLPVFFYYLNQLYKSFEVVNFYKIAKLFARCLIKYNKF